MPTKKKSAPSAPKKPFSHVINMRVPEDLYVRIQRVVEDEGISLADWCRDALLTGVRRAEGRLPSGDQ